MDKNVSFLVLGRIGQVGYELQRSLEWHSEVRHALTLLSEINNE
jgi:hypothetical protein